MSDKNEVVEVTGVVSQQSAQDAIDPEVLDQYGRDASERTIELASDDAEAIDQEVTAGKWQTYDEALHYVITRGFAEIKRQRDNAKKLFEQKTLKNKRDQWSKLLQSNPELLKNGELLAAMLKELSITK